MPHCTPAPSSAIAASPHQGKHPRGERTQEPPFILALTRNGHMAEHVMDYAINVALRMGYQLLAVHVDTLPFFKDRGRRSKRFSAAMRESEALFNGKAEAKGVAVRHLAEIGKIASVIDRLCHSNKRIEFIVIDKGIRLADVAQSSPVPVFPVITTSGHRTTTTAYTITAKGVFAMSTTSKKRHINNCILFGSLTAALYGTVFAYQDLVMATFTKGGAYALLPVATVFAVSYFHGNFTSSFWSALGIEASKKTAEKRAPAEKSTVTAPRPDTRPRAQVNV